MGAVLLTGATGFVGREILSRFLERDSCHVSALVRAENDDQAAGRLPDHERLTAVAGDIEQTNLGLGPPKAFARGAVPAIPARRDAPVDIVPVDYVADRGLELATRGPNGTFHLVAGRNATTVGRLLEMSSEELGRAEPTVLPPRLYRRWVHPWLRRKYRGLRRLEVYFPYFALRVRFDDRRLGPGPRVESYFHRLVRYAQAARWGRRE